MNREILGVRFDNLTLEEAAQRGIALACASGCAYAVTPNAEIACMARRDPQFLDRINGAALVLPDGVGVIYAARILGRPLKQKVAGVDFAAALMEQMAQRGLKLFLLGAKPGVADRAAGRLREQYPGLAVCGTHDGYFREDEPVITAINDSGADVVFVCLGAPKQECWMAQHREEIRAHLMIGLGGALDLFAGNVQRAPERWRKLGLEWLYRIGKEPRRIKRAFRLPAIIFAAAGERLRGGGTTSSGRR